MIVIEKIPRLTFHKLFKFVHFFFKCKDYKTDPKNSYL